jgi:hypothetical protein
MDTSQVGEPAQMWHAFRPMNFRLDPGHPSLEEFNHTFPFGLPYGMTIPDGKDGPEAVPKKYLEDNIPVGFYTNPPSGAKAVFSTNFCKTPFRNVKHFLPDREMKIFTAAEVQAYCNKLRKRYWFHMKDMAKPLAWEDLWQYFDAHDLYWRGAQNMWNVINHLYDENQLLLVNMWAAQALEIGFWVDEWLQGPYNMRKLQHWNQKLDITSIFSREDKASLGSLNEAEHGWLKDALIYRYHQCFTPGMNTPRRHPRNSLWQAVNDKTVHNWLGKYFGLWK